MKFKNTDDKKMFLLEMERMDLLSQVSEEWEPDSDILEKFITKRGDLTKSVKDFRKSQATKQQWRSHRHKIMRGIKNFHKSTKGKQFHRSLGNFIATRFTGNKADNDTGESLAVYEAINTLKAISSLRTHVYIESEYFMPFSEYVEFLELSDELLESSFIVEKKLLRYDFTIEERELDILARVISPNVLVDSVLPYTDKVYACERFDKAVKDFEDLLISGKTVFESLKEIFK